MPAAILLTFSTMEKGKWKMNIYTNTSSLPDKIKSNVNSSGQSKRPRANTLRLQGLNAIAVAAMSFYSAGSHAADADQSMFSFSGFGTVGVVHSSQDKADFTASPKQPDGAGYSHSWAPGVDSRLGAQISADLTSQLSATLQVVVEQQWDKSYRHQIEWANVKYAFTPDLSVRLGRTILPLFLISDTRKVGFASPMIRPSGEIFRTLSVTSVDGVDVSYAFHAGEVKNTTIAFFGKHDEKFPGFNNAHVTARGIVNNSTYGAATFHVGYLKAKLTVPDLVATPVPAISALGDHGPISTLTVGASYDPGNWFASAEWVKGNADLMGRQSAWTVNAGYRLGDFTPYASYSRLRQDEPSLLFNVAQSAAAVGVRWDVMKNTDVKLQYERISARDGTAGIFTNVQPGFANDPKANVISVAVDFVF